MSKIDAKLKQQFETAPDQTVDLIVRTTSDPNSHAQWCKSNGLTVKQTFRLSPGLAVSGTGAQALALSKQSWVVSVELDQAVQAL